MPVIFDRRFEAGRVLQRIENVAVLEAIILSPFWFQTLFGVNLGIFDLLFAVAFGAYVIRTRSLPIFPSKTTIFAIVGFLMAATIGVFTSPLPFEAIKNYLQYVYIFVVVVPTAFTALSEPRIRRYSLWGLALALNTITLLAIVVGLSGGAEFRHLALFYGNQNQLYWLVACAVLVDLCFALDPETPVHFRALATVLGAFSFIAIIYGLTLSAILMVGAGGWLLAALVIHRNLCWRARWARPFAGVTGASVIAAIAFVILFWDFVYGQGSLDVRSAQYTAAFTAALNTLPFGTGLESAEIVLNDLPPSYARSVHNFFLAYLLELGVLGAFSFTLLLLEWVRGVILDTLGTFSEMRVAYLAPTVIFAAFVVTRLVQPVPVHRFWWAMFAFSWALKKSIDTSGTKGSVESP